MPGAAEEADELLVGEAVELLHVHGQGLTSRLPDLLGQPLEGLHAIIPGRQNMDSSRGGDRPQPPQPPPEGHPGAGA